jgi:hypothetical protein
MAAPVGRFGFVSKENSGGGYNVIPVTGISEEASAVDKGRPLQRIGRDAAS